MRNRSVVAKGESWTIELVEDDQLQDRIVLVGADELSQRAIAEVPKEGCDARLASVHDDSPSVPEAGTPPRMLVVAADLRGGRQAAPAARPRDILTIGVVLVESRNVSALTAWDDEFDAVLPILCPTNDGGLEPLAHGVAAVTAFAAANRISMPVDAIYPVLFRAGLLTWGRAEGTDVHDLVRRAAIGAGLEAHSSVAAAMVHVESTESDYLSDMALAMKCIPGVARLEPTASVSPSTSKVVSVVAVRGNVAGEEQ